MYFKKIISCLFVVAFMCQGAEYSPPKSPRTPPHRILPSRSTPPRYAASRFWEQASSTESSPAKSPVKFEEVLSPLGKRKSGELYGLDSRLVSRKLSFESVSDASLERALDATSAQRARNILGQLPAAAVNTDVKELIRHLPPAPDISDLDEYNDVSLAVVQTVNDRYKKMHGTALDFLPLLPFKHIREGDSKGGYHIESYDKPVIRLLENPKTGVYGGTFGRSTRLTNSKFSSFFAPTKSFNDAVNDIHYAYRHPVISTGDGLIGQTKDGYYIQVLITPWAITARTAFPLVEYIPAGAPEDEPIVLKHVDPGHRTPVMHEYTVGQLRALADRGRPAELDMHHRAVVDIGEILTGRPEVRGVYVEVPRRP